jgi:drug/metabolite transporter (DMT)-like permease
MVIFLYTAPIFTALGLHLTLPAERLSARQWSGIGVAFLGIVTAFAGGFLQSGVNGTILIGDLLGILAGAGWGITTVVIRCSTLSNAPPAKTLIYQLAAASLLILGYAAATGQLHAATMTGVVWASLLFQAVVVSFASYLAWFWLLTRYLASRLATFSFMTPLFGVFFGVMLLREPVDGYFGAGALLVLSGIVLVSYRRTGRLPAAAPLPAAD